MDARELLSGIPIFAEALEPAQIKLLASESRPAFFLAGTRLMSQGDLGGSMVVIVKGDVSVRFVDEGAREKTVAALGPGDIVGEMSLFTGDRRTATVGALTNVDAIEITKPSLERVFAKSPDLMDRFATVLAKRQAELNALIPAHGPAREAFLRQARKVFTGLFRAGR